MVRLIFSWGGLSGGLKRGREELGATRILG